MTTNEKPSTLEIVELAAKLAMAKAQRDAVKTLNTVESDFPKVKRTFTYKKAGQL